MAARMDLEARLRALRAPTGSGKLTASAPSPVVAPAAPLIAAALPVAPGAELKEWPEPPLAWPEPPMARPRRKSGALGEVMAIPRRSSVGAPSGSSQRFQPPAPVPGTGVAVVRATATAATDATPSGVSVASLLGPAYAEAVQVAQYAIENERNRNVHTAIDAYIRAGQMLIRIGRQQDAAHLQTIVKKKALALLERAEGLSDWVSTVMAGNLHSTNSAEVVDAAFAESQRAHEQALTEKEALVAQMKSENSEMTQKLNQLVLLTKVRTRFRRVLSERRARKAAAAAETQHSASLEDDDTENNANSGNCNDVEGDDSGAEADGVREPHDDRHSSVSSSRGLLGGTATVPAAQERETQKRDLINELHARIGLPEISTLRKFTPLSADATKDLRHVELEDELDAARLEAERLRAAVHEMEDAFQTTLELTRRQSLKLNQQKDENLAQMEDELQRVRDELELERERRLSAPSSGSGGGSHRSFRSGGSNHSDEDDDPDAFEDMAMIRSLRSSLHAMAAPAASSDSADNRPRADGEKQTTASRRGWSKSESEGDSSDADVDDDGGVWL
ncbi:hypothetical protein PybrP1_002204 [[Pythium] brassicae (nom. inval.)]|nr:hypothetical protein PybrP1_002204 [[Pythium] brassicae (nom. inval.)]